MWAWIFGVGAVLLVALYLITPVVGRQDAQSLQLEGDCRVSPGETFECLVIVRPRPTGHYMITIYKLR